MQSSATSRPGVGNAVVPSTRRRLGISTITPYCAKHSAPITSLERPRQQNAMGCSSEADNKH